MNNIKVTYGNQTKRISELVTSYEMLMQLVNRLFNLEKELGQSFIRLCYLDKENEKIEISSEEDFLQVIKYHKDQKGDTGMKIEVILSSLKDSLNVDEMLMNMKLSESFAVVDRVDYNKVNQEPKNFIKVEDGNESLQVSSLSKEVHNVSGKINYHGKEEKGVQGEIIKVEVNEAASNTNNLEIKEEFTQMENKIFVDEGSDPEKVNTKEVCVQAEQAEFKDNCKPNNTEVWKSVQEVNNPQVEKNPNLNSSSITEEVLISKIEEILSNRMAQMEDNFKKMLEIQQQSKLNVQNENFSSNLQLINLDNINLASKLKPENRVEQIDHKIELNNVQNNHNDKDNNLIKDISNPNGFYKSKEEAREESLYHSNDYCSVCHYQILKNKYICIMCDKFILCSQCEDLHNQHPLLKVNVNNQSLTSKEELARYLVKLNKDKKKGLLKKGFSGIRKLFKPVHYLTLYPKTSSTVFAMPVGSTLKYPIVIRNAGNKKIEEEIVIVPMNIRTFNVNAKLIGGLDVNATKEVEFIFEAPQELGTFDFEIVASMKKSKLLTEPLKFEISVVDKSEVDEANANLMFGQFDEIMGLPKDKRIVLYKMISQEVIKKDIEEIIRIIKKYDYDIMSAIDELTTEENNENYNYDESCYYGMDY